MTDGVQPELRPPRPSMRHDVARLVIVLVVLVALVILLMAATHIPSGGCGGG